MTKLDWRKAKSRETDPARQQPIVDFVEPDQVVVSRAAVTRKEISAHRAKQKKERASEARRWPSRVAAEAREAERLAEVSANRTCKEALREARQQNLAYKKAVKKARKRKPNVV